MTHMPVRLTVVTLGAKDLPALRRFYRDLGWTERPGNDDSWAAFLLGGVLLAMYPLRALADEVDASYATALG